MGPNDADLVPVGPYCTMGWNLRGSYSVWLARYLFSVTGPRTRQPSSDLEILQRVLVALGWSKDADVSASSSAWASAQQMIRLVVEARSPRRPNPDSRRF